MASSSSISSSMLSVSILIILFSVVVVPSSAAGEGGGFTVELIHRDSIASPFYNPSLTHSDRLRERINRSITRANHLASRTFHAAVNTKETTATRAPTPEPEQLFDLISDVYPNNFEYLMALSVGTPPTRMLAVADTGSDLIWTQCKPCNRCYKQHDPLFDPSSSSSYRILSCNTDLCRLLPEGSCSSRSLCEYRYSYGDGSKTSGVLSTETITFNTSPRSSRRPVPIKGIAIGCTHQSKGTFDGRGSGLVGLGGGELSLVTQLGSKISNRFSYCLVPLSQNLSSLLNFGGDAAMSGNEKAVTTPLADGSPNTFYYLNLQKVIIGETSINVGPLKGSGNGDGEGNIIIDSGTTVTFLPDDTLRAIQQTIGKSVSLPTAKDPQSTFSHCFRVKQEDPHFPAITLRFDGNADVELKQENTFLHTADDVVCLAFLPASLTGDLPILGNIAQQNFHIVYDLGGKTISFAPANCARK